MRKIAFLLALSIIAFLAALFQFRGELREAYGRWQRGPIPEAVSPNGPKDNPPDYVTETENDPHEPAVNAPADEPVVEPPKPEKPAVKPDIEDVTVPHEPYDGTRPEKYNLSVLFVPQAPMKVWDEMHEDTCEEASMLMVKAYRDEVTEMSVERMEKRLLDFVNIQKRLFGDDTWKSADVAVIAAIMRDELKISTARVVTITSIDDVKDEIAKGHPVILPAAGKLLKNPNFRNGGPLYHMLVAKGYTKNTVVTNDPGTRLGADYAYEDEVLWEAIHDWNGGDVMNGAKVMIVAE